MKIYKMIGRLGSLMLIGGILLSGLSSCAPNKTVDSSSNTVINENSEEVVIESSAISGEISEEIETSSAPKGETTVNTSRKGTTNTKSNISSIPTFDDSAYPLKVKAEKQEVDILREDTDTVRRLVYLRFQNTAQKFYKGLKLTYTDNGKNKTRDFMDITIGDKFVYDTMWISSNATYTEATLSSATGIVWKGVLTIQPASRSVTVKKSKTYSLSELTPMSLRGINYYPRYTPWTALNTQSPKVWDSEFAEIEKLNVNAIRAINDKTDSDMKLGGCVTPEFLEIMNTFFATAYKHGLRTMFCLTAPSEALTKKMREVRSVLEPFINDGRVIGWDLTNEPDALGLGDGEHPIVDTFCTTVYPKMSEWDPNHLNNMGLAWMVERPAKAGVTFNGPNQCWQYHWYRKFTIETVTNLYNTHFNKRPFIIGECGDTDHVSAGDPLRPGATAEKGAEWQKETYEEILKAANQAAEKKLPLIGIFPWTTFEFPNMMSDSMYEATLGIIREDGSLKLAGQTLRDGYAKLRKTNPAPWEK